MNNSSGSGFGSKLYYGSGFFHLNIKVPGRNSAGVVTAFYLHSASSQGWDELDFEFLGNLEGKPILLQTNVFTIGKGYREQRIKLWFDPTSSFHDYKILWNPYQIVFYVDEVPIRVFENKTSQGVSYPSKPMQIQASIWNGEDWATDGGRTKTNWSYAPFFANFRGFDIDGCRSDGSNDATCSSSSLWWNSARFRELNHDERLAYQNVKRNYMDYDYCADRKRHPTTPPECPQ
ncbi:Xyloglucan endotransglucosylase/hydrolase protein 2 [Apostasia shenzhenica]|uniref:Xyloglucan endotransglucosylase/hydrolase n=1 Tax=Apostasia shenzhenica TaxID=1088818 RepID=A0A2H9ZZX9_9ASPA|nr:Xyloglucan endotransglucosylase/hydrolase protein 2 [Apostasia shenzhenica]